MKSRGLGAVGFFLIIGFWHIISAFVQSADGLVPSPAATLDHSLKLLLSNNGLRDIFETLARFSVGFLLAALVGISVGMIVGVNRQTFQAFSPIIDFFRSTPVTCLYPVFIILFGVDHVSKVGMIFFACVFVVILNTSFGMLSRSKKREQMARLFGANRYQRFVHIYIFEALPHITAGLRTGLSFCYIVAILCEMFMGSEFGIGQRITLAFGTYRMEELFSWILISGIIGCFLNRLFDVFEKRITWWE